MSGDAAVAIAIRAATEDDAATIMAIWAVNGYELPDGGADLLTPYLAHLMRTGRVLVAEHAGQVVGFGAVVVRGGVTHLADLFVRPNRFGQGIGGQLLTAVFGDAPVRTTFASADPRAMPLYVRAGMIPMWPNVYLDVDSSSLPWSPMVCEPADAEQLAQLEASWLGNSNVDDHRLWASLPGARPFAVLDGARPVAAVHARSRRTGRDRWINRLVMAPDSDAAAVIVAAYCHAAERGRIGSCLPGPNPALPILLAAGARIVDHDTYMASHPSLFDPTRRITDGGIL